MLYRMVEGYGVFYANGPMICSNAVNYAHSPVFFEHKKKKTKCDNCGAPPKRGHTLNTCYYCKHEDT